MSAQTSDGLLSHPVTYFHPSPWGDQFLHLADPVSQATQREKEQEVEHLKEEVKKELLATADKRLEQLDFIDAIERLGVAHYFEKEIEEALLQDYVCYCDQCHLYDLYHVSTQFRILRQHGFYVPCDIFIKKIKDEKGEFKMCILNDIRGILSLYEASEVRIHGDDVLDEANVFATTHLQRMMDDNKLINSYLREQIAHALHQPLHKGLVRLESKHYIGFYEQHASHNKTLLNLAKLDFNLLQSLHQQELRDISGWWKDFYSKVPFARDRLVEAYFWVLGCYYEAKYSHARKLFIKIFMIVQVFDDIFDAYGTFEILNQLVEAVYRWDHDYIAQLPQYFNICYQKLLETVDEIEEELAKDAVSYGVHYLKQQMNRVCEAWLEEAKWCCQKHIPTYDEYMRVATISIGQTLGILASFLGIGPIATKEGYEWVCQNPMPKLIEALHRIFRLMNDIGSTEFEQTTREHVVSSVQCYMKENNVSDLDKENVYQILEKQVENEWKEFNQAMLRPYAIPKPLMDLIFQQARAINVFYKGRTDGYTNVNQIIKDKIVAVLVDPIP